MKDYYVVYDMTPKDELNENWIQVGIGRQNDVNMFGDEHYSLETYEDDQGFTDNLKEAFKTEDSSRHIDFGKEDESSSWSKYIPDVPTIDDIPT